MTAGPGPGPGWTDADLAALGHEGRAELLRRLAVLQDLADPVELATIRRRRRRFVEVLVVATVVLVPWIVGLALTLPKRYEASDWVPVWVGFDVALVVGMAVTAWAAWRRRQVLVVSALVTGTLLTVDAWFDVLTAHSWSDRWVSVATAVLGELPLAALMFLVAYRILRRTTRHARTLVGLSGPAPALRHTPMFLVEMLDEEGRGQA